MEWTKLLEGALGSSPIALVLGFAVWNLWSSNQKKDAELQRLNDARVSDLRDMISRD